MANRKAVFLDVDGTLVNDRGRVPDSARQAVRAARANGHLVFLCTGRSPAELWPELIDIGFDGLIAASGAFVEVGEDVLVHHCLTAGDVDHVLGFFGSRQVDFYFQANDGIYATPEVRARLRTLIGGSVTDTGVLAELERGLFGFVDAIKVDADPYATRITKVIYLFSGVTIDELRAEFADRLRGHPVVGAALRPEQRRDDASRRQQGDRHRACCSRTSASIGRTRSPSATATTTWRCSSMSPSGWRWATRPIR